MTPQDFMIKVEVMGSFDFNFEGKIYRLSSEKNGKIKIMEQDNFLSVMNFESYKAMMAECKIGNRFLKEIIQDL